ncbi:MAG: glycosyltransferase [Planctomycetes bacterium]|nr:glycosyltransferase [Planctomycetota bacterium]
MKLAFVTASVDPAHPTLAFTRSWVRALQREVPSLRVISREGTPFEGEPALDLRVAFPGGHRSEQTSLLRRAQWALFLRRELRGCDAVLAHMVPRDALWARRCLGASARIGLWYAHGSVGKGLGKALRACDRVFTPSERAFPMLATNLCAFGHGIDLQAFASRPAAIAADDAPILFAARLSATKEPELALAGYRIWRERTRLAPRRLHFVGAPLTKDDRALAAKLEAAIGGDALVRAPRAATWAEMPTLYGNAALLLAPSRTGSLDKNVLEAHACGVPAIVLAESGAAEHVAHVDPEGISAHATPEELATAIERLLALPPEEAARRAARRRALVAAEHDLVALARRITGELAHGA